MKLYVGCQISVGSFILFQFYYEFFWREITSQPVYRKRIRHLGLVGETRPTSLCKMRACTSLFVE